MFQRAIVPLILFCIAFSHLCGQPEPASPPAASAVNSAANFDPAQATQAWLASVPAAERAKSDAYFEGGYWLILWNFLLTAAICVFLLQSKISARLRDFAEKLTRSNTLRVAIYSVPFIAIFALL